MFLPVQTVAPVETPVSLAQAKAHLRVDYTDDDTLISTLIDVATAHLDGYSGVLGRALVTQTWRADYRGFSDFRSYSDSRGTVYDRLSLPLAPVQSVTSVQYYDATNTQQTLSSSIYSFLSDERGPYVGRLRNQNWPNVYDREDPVRITFVAGYGAASAVPAAIRQALLLLIGAWYEQRENSVIDMRAAAAEMPDGVCRLIEPFRRVGI